MIISTLGGRRGNDWRDEPSNVCLTVSERVRQVTKVVRAKELRH